MATVSLGKIAFKWRSTYNAGTTYMRQDVVAYNGDSFVCVVDNTVGIIPTDASANWDMFAQGTAGVSTSGGQIIYNNGSGLVALPAGISGQVLTVGAGGLPVWATPQVRSGTRVLRLPENATNTQPNSYRKMGVIMSDGSIRAWGQQTYYLLGDGTTFSRSYPVRTAFPPGFPGASKLYYGYDQQAACIDNNGQLWLWGNNEYGACGNGNTTVVRVPYNASADAANSIFGKTVIQYAIPCGTQGAISSLALCSDGTVHSCGYNGYGQLGVGSTTSASRFAQLPVLSNIVEIEAGRENYTSYYARTSAGALYSWGYNGDGQLGDGGTTNATIATLRTGGSLAGKVITKMFAGPNYAMAIDSLGNLHAWGTNTYGQLGNGTLSNQFTPVQSVTGNVSDVYIGQYDYNITYMKKTDNSLWGCGYGEYWANGVTPAGTNTGTFTQIISSATPINKAVHGGSGTYNFGAALLQNGTVRVWGYNGNGALGLGDVTTRTTAANSMLTGNRVVTDICAYGGGSEQGMVMLLDDGQLFAVGYGGGSQLPEDDSETSYTPMPVLF
jgi:alpha-tubulin suppressor-like RCC1 family protein